MATAFVGWGFHRLLSACLSARYLKNDFTGITKLDIQMVHDTSWKPIYFGVEKSKVKVTSHKNIAGVGICTFVSAGFFWFVLSGSV